MFPLPGFKFYTPPAPSYMPYISQSKPTYGTGTASRLFDKGYGYTTVTPGAWACTAGDWAAINLGAGPSQLMIQLSNDDAVYTGSFIVSLFEDYRIQVSNDSTNGADGTWTTVVTVTGNPVANRVHKINFTGYSWVKLLVDACSNGKIDEMDIWDASNNTDSTYAFVGDSITIRSLNRATFFGGGNRPSFQDVIETNKGYYPLMSCLGISGSSVGDWSTQISTEIARYPDIKNWCISLGTNNGNQMPAQIATFNTQLTSIITALQAAGKTIYLARVPWTGSATYGGGDVNTCGLKYLNDNGIDVVRASTGVLAGPDLYQLFYDNRVEYVVETDPHPAEPGTLGWQNAWAGVM